jgi:hypothetical protein
MREMKEVFARRKNSKVDSEKSEGEGEPSSAPLESVSLTLPFASTSSGRITRSV